MQNKSNGILYPNLDGIKWLLYATDRLDEQN